METGMYGEKRVKSEKKLRTSEKLAVIAQGN